MHKVTDGLLAATSVGFAGLDWVYQLDKPLGLLSKVIAIVVGVITIYRFFKEKQKNKNK